MLISNGIFSDNDLYVFKITARAFLLRNGYICSKALKKIGKVRTLNHNLSNGGVVHT